MMRPLAALPEEVRRHLDGVFCDIDDTLTTAGRLTADAYSAMERLHAHRLAVVPITGRPAGWCDHIARMWPVAAVVGENGAFYFRYDHVRREMKRRFADDAAQRVRNRERLAAIGQEIVRAVPGCAIAADQGYRETDLAIDYCEDVTRLRPSAVERIVALMRSRGLTAKVSSIHVNGWFGTYDKLAMTRTLFAEQFATDLDRDNVQFAFAGDSPNDAPMFAYFANAIGVANVARFLGHLPAAPKFVTRHAAGAGFAEIVAHALGAS